MRVGLGQVNTRIGDLRRNADAIIAATEAAWDADLIVLPELVLTGYPPRDLLFDDRFVDDCEAALQRVAEALRGAPPVVLGAPIRAPRRDPHHPGLYDAAVVVHEGRVVTHRAKRLLPAYDVFHEPRWFVPGPRAEPVTLGGLRLGLLVCEDLWDEGYAAHPPADLVADGAQLLVSLSASPYRRGVVAERLRHARRTGRPIVWVNAVGAHDELIFDGRSFVLDAAGREIARLPAFEEAVVVVDLDDEPGAPQDVDDLADVYDALVLGIRDFCWKNGVRDAWLGLSGGIDSALVACLAVAALGAAHVHALAMPSRFTDPRSTDEALALARTLGIDCQVVPIDGLHTATEEALAPLLAGAPPGDTTGENVQARLRMLVLTAHLNRRGGVLLNTSNQTELALGYGTLYADLAGSLSPIGDLDKVEVVALATWIAANRVHIPTFILERTPSAELAPDQVDPFDYPRVAPAVRALVRGEQPTGLPEAEVTGLARKVRAAEHKRWQHGVILKVSDRAFGTGRMLPITRAR